MVQKYSVLLLTVICTVAFLMPGMPPENADSTITHYGPQQPSQVYPVMREVPPLPSHPGTKPAAGDPPASFSWRDHDGDWTTAARDQGSCGSCWAFAALSALEGVINVREGIPELDPNLSEQYVLSCLPASGSCSGGSPYQAYRWIMDTGDNGNGCNGVIPEACFAYQADDGVPCTSKCPGWENQLVPITDYGFWDSDGGPADRERIKTQVMEEGPVVTYIEATEDFTTWGATHHGRNDVYPYHSASGHNHCVSIVGWKDDSSIEHGGYWICKNSWGTAWGHQGFFNIEYGSLNIDTVGICWVDYDPESVNWPPAVDAGGPYHAAANEAITFDGSGCRDAEGEITSYEWTFDDGTVLQGQSVSHAFETRGIHTITLTVSDEDGNQNTACTAAYIEPWQTDESWTYRFDEIHVELDDGVSGDLDARISGLSFSVERPAYTLSFKGKMTGAYDLTSPIACTGKILWSSIRGTVEMNQEFGFTDADVTVRALATVQFPELPLPIPVPVTLKGNISFTDPWKILEFPLEEEKEWSTSLASVSLEGSASTLLGLISQPFSYSLTLPAIPATCHGMETVNVDAGAFDAYHVSYLNLVDIWYAPAVSNIVKITAAYEESNLAGELSDSSHR
ncbi:MAG: C1 family peptidase [Thermoplasmatota archaeon]